VPRPKALSAVNFFHSCLKQMINEEASAALNPFAQKMAGPARIFDPTRGQGSRLPLCHCYEQSPDVPGRQCTQQILWFLRPVSALAVHVLERATYICDVRNSHAARLSFRLLFLELLVGHEAGRAFESKTAWDGRFNVMLCLSDQVCCSSWKSGGWRPLRRGSDLNRPKGHRM
jgi:hypothetical protein